VSDQDNPFLKYFDAEMRYLRDASKEFARQDPQAARRLGLTTPGALNDRVEQLYQGFAFLMARLRMKLDDALPEITDPLLDNLWPHAARTIPSLAILECVPRAGEARVLGTLPAGLQVRSTPVGPDGTACVYRTTQPVHLLPLDVCEAGARVREDGRTVISIAFNLLNFEQRRLDDLSRIRLYLHGERPTASALYAALTRQVASIDVRIPSIHDGRLQPQPDMNVEVAGFGPGTRLWPSDNAKRNHELDREQTMLEYFSFPEKFHFIDLCGFDAATVPLGETRIEFEILLNGRLAGDFTFGKDNIRLFCTPVINLFEVDAEPLRPHAAYDREHPVHAPGTAGGYVEPYDALSVTATDQESSERHEYRAFKSFRHRGGMMRYESPERYFHTSTRFSVTGNRQLWVNLGGQFWEHADSPPDGHLTVRALANNGRLPRMALRESMISDPASNFKGIHSVRNLTPPTMPLYPPRDREYDWQVISHFSGGGSNELNMMDESVLRGALALYDWTRQDDNGKRIAAIARVWLTEENLVQCARVLRDIHIHVAIDAAAFAGAGDVVLFGDVLSHFVGRYANFHHSVRLVLIADGKETVYPRTDFKGAPF
jgi:type VI secretion system protein ImpG